MEPRKKRLSARVSRPVEVQYTIKEQFGWTVGRLLDFGWDGARLVGSRQMDPGLSLRIRLVVPGEAGLEVLTARVLWAQAQKGTGAKWQHGIVFTSAPEKVQETVGAAIRYVLQNMQPDAPVMERRRSTRVFKPCEAVYHEPERRVSGWRRAVIVDLSVHGAQFKSGNLLKSGEVIELRLPAGDDEQPIVMRGRVVWSQGVPDEASHGVEFLSPSPGHEESFEAFVQWLAQPNA